jgi:hypothetical protein
MLALTPAIMTEVPRGFPPVAPSKHRDIVPNDTTTSSFLIVSNAIYIKLFHYSKTDILKASVINRFSYLSMALQPFV